MLGRAGMEVPGQAPREARELGEAPGEGEVAQTVLMHGEGEGEGEDVGWLGGVEVVAVEEGEGLGVAGLVVSRE